MLTRLPRAQGFVLIDVTKDTTERIAEVIASLKLQPGRGLAKAKTDLSGPAVWDLVTGDGGSLLLKTSLVAKRFAVNVMYKGASYTKPKLDFVIDKQLANADKLEETLRLIIDKWRTLAMAAIPAEHTGEWADEANRVSKAFLGAPSGKPGPKLLVPSKAKPDGSGSYDPLLAGVSIKMKAPGPDTPAFVADESLIKFPPENNTTRSDYLRVLKEKLPPTLWDTSVSGIGGKPLDAAALLNGPLTGNAVLEFSSVMLMPTSTLSLQVFLKAFRLSESDTKRKFDEAALEAALWDDDPVDPAAFGVVKEVDEYQHKMGKDEDEDEDY